MKIEREIIQQFKEWKKADTHKPILLKGARQIGNIPISERKQKIHPQSGEKRSEE